MSKEIKRYYKNYSNTEHNYSNILTDQQYMFVDYCLGFPMKAIAKDLYKSGRFSEWSETTILDSLNDALGGGVYDFWNDPENYEAWYDEDENTVIENIWEALDELCEDYAELISGDYAQYLQDEIKSLKAEIKKLKKEEKRFNAEVA